MNHIPPFQIPASRAAMVRGLFIALIMACMGARAGADDTIPPVPENHFNDYAHVVTPAVAAQFEAGLAKFEKDTSGRIVVAIYPHMQSDAGVEDYAKHLVQVWKTARNGKEFALVLVIFMNDHTMSLRAGDGYEKTVTDDICLEILHREIVPHFSKNDFAGGLAAALNAMIAATRGEYKPSIAPVGQLPAVLMPPPEASVSPQPTASPAGSGQ